ncbi:MAG: 5-(carboxyamino)imidazole ribonucleotide synthase [Schleiferiaceae bacterium]|nr:5-(carboxyamino)imidazole ribonucleotide synthase [Schleiferiaceae bacterium]
MASIFSNPDFQIALLGGGQLGKMILSEARRMDIAVRVLDPSADAPCRLGAQHFVQGSFMDFDTVMAFAEGAQAVAIEIESVNADALEALEAKGVPCFPQSHVLRIIQNKVAQKQFYADHGLPTSDFQRFSTLKELTQAIDLGRLAFPFVWKLGQGGYDGFGVSVIRIADDLAGLSEGECIAETLVDIGCEIGVVVARNKIGESQSFPAVEMEFHPTANQVEFVVCPSALPPEAIAEAEALALRVSEAFNAFGLLAVELFYTKSGQWLVNEVAPRPHNSGHLTIEACSTSQFEQLLRCMCGLPMGDSKLLHPAVMANIVGAEGFSGPVRYDGLSDAMRTPGTAFHIYGKAQTRPFRKMGHLTSVGRSVDEARARAAAARDALQVRA